MAKVLIIDDEDSFRSTLLAVLSARLEGAQIFEAANSAQAFQVIDAEKPDLLILDLNLNEKLTGFDVLRKTLESLPDIKTLVVTGNIDDDVEKTAKELKVKEVIQKPVSLSALLAKIKESL